ncbi:MAG: aldehyde dehydrogenase family protein [Balneolia bacterium]|nr:aldehyde dehydrogenase family protein [Balneolia bacterium]
MSKRLDVKKTYKLYIGGAFPRSESDRYYSLNDKSGNFVANICRGSRKDFKNAVVAARKAQSGWASRTAYNRGQILYRIAEMMEGRKDQLIAELKLEGSTEKQAVKEVEAAIDRAVYFAGWSDKYQQIFGTINPVASSHFNFSVPEPTGVVAIVLPESASLLGFMQYVLPAIVGGNTVVVLASEKKPLAVLTLAEILHSSDVPGGVINILCGFRDELLSNFSSHMDVNALMLGTNDKDAITLAQQQASQNVKPVLVKHDDDFLDEKHENPYAILELQEIKTTWHPIGI